MLHHVGLGKGDDRARLESHDGDVHIVAEVGRIDKAGRRPFPVGFRHHRGGDIGLVRYQNVGL